MAWLETKSVPVELVLYFSEIYQNVSNVENIKKFSAEYKFNNFLNILEITYKIRISNYIERYY